METFQFFIPMTKVDVEQRLVYGVFTAEVPDASGEVMDYESGKPHFQEWSNQAYVRSGGKSKGNIRAMHESLAAGKLVDIHFDDANKVISGCAKIVDDAEWTKVLEGVYTGFSIGGKYAKRWPDPSNSKLMRYTPVPSEISIVDNPCCPTATFSMVKADGSVTEIAFKHKEKPMTIDKETLRKNVAATIEQGWLTKDSAFYLKRDEAIEHALKLEEARLAKKEFSDEKRKEMADKGHAMPDGSFPIEDAKDVQNAVLAHGRAKDPKKAKAHIIARAKEIGATEHLPTDWEGSTKDKEAEKVEKKAAMKKDLEDVARTACIIEHLNWLAQSVSFEEAIEDDEESKAPAQLENIIHQLCEYLEGRVKEETDELLDRHEAAEYAEGFEGVEEDAEKAVSKVVGNAEKYAPLLALFAKKGARHSAKDKEHGEKLDAAVDEMHDHLEESGDHIEKIKKLAGKLEDAHKDIEEAHKARDFTKAASHLDKAEGHVEKMHKSIDKLEEVHKSMEECAKEAGEHVEAMGLGEQSGSSADDKNAEEHEEGHTGGEGKDIEKLAKAAAEAAVRKVLDDSQAALAKAKTDADAAIAKTKADSDKTIAELTARLKKLEDQPLPGKGVLFAVRKGNESQEPETKTVDADTSPKESLMRGLSPADMRRAFKL